MKHNYARPEVNMGLHRKPKEGSRQQIRSLAEFSREVGVSVYVLLGCKAKYTDFPVVGLQSRQIGYYNYRALQDWWGKHGSEINVKQV